MIDVLLAIRNLLRNRRRSMSTLMALALGLSAILLFSGFQANLASTMLTAVVRGGGHFQIQHRDYFTYGSANPAEYAIANYGALVDEIRQDPVLRDLVLVATPLLRFGGLAGNFDAGISRPVIGTGWVADDVDRMRKWNEFQVPNSRPDFPLVGRAPDAAIVGLGVARVLQLCEALKVDNCQQAPSTRGVLESSAGKPGPKSGATELPADIAALAATEVASTAAAAKAGGGARIELLSGSSRGTPNVAQLQVVAAEDQVFKELDEISVIVHLAQAQRLVFGKQPPKANAILVVLKRTADVGTAAKRLQAIAAKASSARTPLVSRDFGELNPFYKQSEMMFDFIFGFILVLIGGIVLFTVSNTMHTAVVERTVEIGTLRAIGLRRGGIRKLFIVEGFLLGWVGAALGVLLALGIGELVNRSGVTWLPPGSSERLPLQLRVLNSPWMVLGYAVLLVAIASLSAWWPAWRAAKLKIVDALRHA